MIAPLDPRPSGGAAQQLPLQHVGIGSWSFQARSTPYPDPGTLCTVP